MKVKISKFIFLLFIFASFISQANPVTNGSFEELDKNGFPVDWVPVGGAPVTNVSVATDSHTGKYSLRIQRLKEERGIESGANRWWIPYSGNQGAMLSELKGAISFWYKVNYADVNTSFVFYVIPMSSKPWEDTGIPRESFTIPREHIGDGLWHRGVVVYDFSEKSEVKWVMIAPRIQGGRGDWLIDDVEYNEKVGAVPKIGRIYIEEVTGKEGEEGILKVEIQNIGDSQEDLEVSLILPSSLQCFDLPSKKLKSVKIKEFPPQELYWRIKGKRERGGNYKIKGKVIQWMGGLERI